jgi:serine/threonine-protein kinase
MRKALEGVPVEKFPPPPSQFFGAVEGTPPPDVLVPSVVGMSLTEAGAVLRDAGLAVGESLCLSREVAEGTVVRQSPMPGRTAPGGSTVTICVAVHSLPEPEDNRPDDEENAGTPVSQAGTVPNVVGESRARAQANLSEAGFEMASVRECDPSDASEAGRVWKQDPSGGTSAPTGTTVTVWYNGASC